LREVLALLRWGGIGSTARPARGIGVGSLGADVAEIVPGAFVPISLGRPMPRWSCDPSKTEARRSTRITALRRATLVLTVLSALILAIPVAVGAA